MTDPTGQELSDSTVTGDVFQIRDVAGNVTVRADRPAWWTRSGYIEQVRDIAPLDGLKDRDAELAALRVGTEPCTWWRAGPWAGKSALMSTFVLNPPPGTEIVSFFITARLAAQADSSAFTDALLDQLSALLGESLPPSLTPAMRDAHRRALLRAAVDRLHTEGRRLILVVDGLDEDAGVRPGSGLPSVASLLPKQIPDGLRIVVASRPAPPIPADVPTDHPLRRCRIRELPVSPHATEIAAKARAELRELLTGDQAHRDVIGYLTAAGGGLTLAELEELTGLPPFRLADLMGGVFGRTVAERTGQHYLFTHETLRAEAITQLGVALNPYRERIHAWADSFAAQGWPSRTPQYLLRGYPRMLVAEGRNSRLAALAVDRSRQDRLLDLTGGDAAALAEIKAAQDALLTEEPADLLALARLAVRRNEMSSRNAAVPVGLPALWAVLGQHVRAEAVARGIEQPDRLAEALARLAHALRTEPAERNALGGEAVAAALAIADTGLRDRTLGTVAAHLAEAGIWDVAESAAAAVVEPLTRQRVWRRLISITRAGGRDRDVTGLVRRARSDVASVVDPSERSAALADLAEDAAWAGEIIGAIEIAADIDDISLREVTWIEVARAAAGRGDADRAIELIGSSLTPDHRVEPLAGVAAILVRHGRPAGRGPAARG